MQITINTSDILGDETTIRDEVIKEVVTSLTLSMRQHSKQILLDTLETEMKKCVKEAVSNAVNVHLDTEFTPIDDYGRVGKTETVRNRIAEIVKTQCTFKHTTYSSDRTAFTEAVLATVKTETEKFKKDFDSLVTRTVIEQSADIALAKLKAAMGIK